MIFIHLIKLDNEDYFELTFIRKLITGVAYTFPAFFSETSEFFDVGKLF